MTEPPSPKRRRSLTGALLPAKLDRIPDGATQWSIYKVSKRTVQTDKGPRASWARTRLMGDALEDGRVPETWPVSEFALPRILERWGAGRYSVEFLKGDGTSIKPLVTFELADPSDASRGPPLKPRTIPRPADEEASMHEPSGERMGILDTLTLLESREQRAYERMRIDAERQAERDRNVFQMMMQSQQQLFATFAAAQGNKGAAPDADLIRRELNVTIREQMASIKAQVTQAIGAVRGAAGDDEPYEPPKDLGEAGSRLGIRVVEELEEKAPELIDELIPNIVNFFKRKGVPLSDELTAEAEAQRRARATARAVGRAQRTANGATAGEEDANGE